MWQSNACFFYVEIVVHEVLFVLIAFIERLTRNYILTFTEIFLWKETALSAHKMESYEKLCILLSKVFFFSVEKNGNVVIEKYFSFISKLILRFFLLLTVPLI